MDLKDSTKEIPESRFPNLPNEIKGEIASHVEEKDLCKLAQTCWVWYFVATPHLYSKNAKFSNSSAIKWVSRRKISFRDENVYRKILRLAVEHGANVSAVHRAEEDEMLMSGNRHFFWSYASALHFAAASGNENIVRDLLKYGADVCALSFGFNMPDYNDIVDPDQPGTMSRYGRALYSCFSENYWLPLLLPLIRNHKKIVRMLIDAGAPAQLSVSRPNWRPDPNKAVVTIYHLLAALPEEEYQDDMRSIRRELIGRCKLCLNATLPSSTSMFSALHIALQLGRPGIVRTLLRAGADVDVSADLGRTPLIYAIKLFADGPPLSVRESLLQTIEDLVKHGANVNRRSHPAAGESPLICVIPAAFIRFSTSKQQSKAFADIKKVVDLLLEHGARINDRNSTGRTVIHKLWEEMIFMSGDHGYPEKLLEHLVSKGGDINLTADHGGPTILRELLITEARKTKNDAKSFQLKLLLELRASINPYEVEAVFNAWIESSRLRSKYERLQHMEHLSQGTINQAYIHAFLKQDRKLFLALRAAPLNPTNGSELVEHVVKVPRHKLWEEARDLNFDPNWLSSQGDNYLHMIVRKVGNDGYSEKRAIEDAGYFIQLGTSVCTKNTMGLTPIQRLRRLQPGFQQLRLFLLDEQDKERGEF